MGNKKDLRGRPVKSIIRQNIVELLAAMGQGYGYELYKNYVKVYNTKATIRSIYYHLDKGVETGEFVLHNIETGRGNYSWGSEVKRVIFKLGPNATPKRTKEITNKINLIIAQQKMEE